MRADQIFGVIKDGVPQEFIDGWDFIGKLGEGKLSKNNGLFFFKCVFKFINHYKFDSIKFYLKYFNLKASKALLAMFV